MFKIRPENKDLYSIARFMAHSLLIKVPGITQIALTGSLARDEEKVNDIDLVIFHFMGALGDGFCSTNPETSTLIISGKPNNRTFIMDRLADVSFVPPGVKADLIFIQDRALYDCDYMAEISREETNDDFYKTILCDIPPLPFDIKEMNFSEKRIMHGPCTKCAPRISWKEKRTYRVKHIDYSFGY